MVNCFPCSTNAAAADDKFNDDVVIDRHLALCVYSCAKCQMWIDLNNSAIFAFRNEL